MITTTTTPTTQQPWVSPVLAPTCAPSGLPVQGSVHGSLDGAVRVPAIAVPVVPAAVVTEGHVGRDGKRDDVTGFRAAGAEATDMGGTPAWRPPTS